jgi:hypothetical protein
MQSFNASSYFDFLVIFNTTQNQNQFVSIFVEERFFFSFVFYKVCRFHDTLMRTEIKTTTHLKKKLNASFVWNSIYGVRIGF